MHAVRAYALFSENVAKQFQISRQDQDAFSLTSHAKASTARREGFFEHEIVAVGGVREDDGTYVTSTTIVHMIGYYLLLRVQQRNMRCFSTV